MARYRGMRGRRSFKLEWQERRRVIFIVFLVITFITAGVMLLAPEAEQIIPVVLPVEEPMEPAEYVYYIPPYPSGIQIPICENAGIYFDVATYHIILPEVQITSIESNLAYYIHVITFDGLYIETRRTQLFLNHSSLIINVSKGGNTLIIRTGYGVRPEYLLGEGYGTIQFTHLRDIYNTIIVIDPGHGGMDTGARNVLGGDAPRESEIVLAISQKLLYLFNDPGVLLIPTRISNIYTSTSARYSLANKVADYFISIHTNADGDSNMSQGMLTLYGGAPGSAELAQAFQDALVYALDGRDRGISYAPEIRVLRNSVVPAVLLELLFLSNHEEAARLADPEVQMLIAQTIVEVIYSLF